MSGGQHRVDEVTRTESRRLDRKNNPRIAAHRPPKETAGPRNAGVCAKGTKKESNTLDVADFVRDVEKSSSHHVSQDEIGSDNPCELNRSMQHSSNLLIRLSFSKRPDPLGCTQLNLDRAVFSSHQRSRMNLAVETPADWTSGRCCVDPLRPPLWLLKNSLTSNSQKLLRVRKLCKRFFRVS